MNRKHRRRGFTLVELLVVISIIALLIAILLPSLQTARKQAKKVVCQTNMASLSKAAFTYSVDWGRYPPSISNLPPPQQTIGGKDWLGVGDGMGYTPCNLSPPTATCGVPQGFDAAPRFGALYPLVLEEKAYLCAEDKEGPAKNTVLGGGGNGKFSYTMFAIMGLRPPEAIPPALMDNASGPVRGGGGGSKQTFKQPPAFANVPLFVEEHPTGINGKSNLNGHMEGNFNTTQDFVVSRHPGFGKRKGYLPGSQGTGPPDNFEQGTTNIGYADGHVAALQVNYGFTQTHSLDARFGGRGLGGIPHDAPGLLWYHGVEYREADSQGNSLYIQAD